MTDWTHSTGSSGTMMIRDTGTTVEFWLQAGSATYAYNMPWGYTINGSTDHSNEFRFVSGGAWQRIASWTVTYNQTVTFWLGDTGTSGLGGPTTFSHSINRATVPGAPTKPTLTSITSTSMHYQFTDGATNGATIDSRQVGYGTSPTYVQYTVSAPVSGAGTISGLTPGTLYYVWARDHNSQGWGPWSPRNSATTLNVPDAPSAVSLSNPSQTTIYAVFWGNGNGGSPILEWQIAYGTSSAGPSTAVSGSDLTITGLQPFTTYYFWARGRNAIGWGPYSPVSSISTLAGARIKVGAVWKQAVPYVRVGGVWKVARPWGKIAGVWKQSS